MIKEIIYINTLPLNEFLDYFLSNKNLKYISEGECFTVYESSNDSIIKIQKLNCDCQKNKEVSYWIDLCYKNQNSIYIPKIQKHYEYHLKNKTINVLEVSKLQPIPENLYPLIKDSFGTLISQDIQSISEDKINLLISKLKNNLYFNNLIEENFSQFFHFLIKQIKEISSKQGDTAFNFDIHYKNLMINPINNKIVIIDCFNCSSYEFE
jgi:hypothetical protein